MDYIIAMETKFIVIKNEHLEVTLCSLGASIYRIIYDGKDMVLTPKDKNDFLKPNIYFGKTIGRLCGRIEAKPLSNLNPQNNERGISLHGGFDGLSTKGFLVDAKPTFAEFHYLSKDGEAGYPGNLILRVRYELIDESLIVTFFAVVDKPCLLSLTNHAYFSLGEESIKNLKLQMENEKYIVVDKRLLPIEYQNIPDKWNFTKGKKLGTTGDIDNYFLFKEKNAVLSSEKYSLNISTNFVGTQIFTDHWLDNVKVFSSKEKLYRGVAIEPQDSQLERKELLPNEHYERYIKYTFKKL